MKTPRTENHPQTANALTLHTFVLPRLPTRLRRLVMAAYAPHGGTQHMTLEAWRDVEPQLIRRLQNENLEHQQ
jgi:hypothetical protein